MASPKHISVFVVLAALAVGCGNGPRDPSDPGGASGSLAYGEPLPMLTDIEWTGATEGCEGRLRGDESFGITRRDALVVASREEGPVCVDTLEAITLDLEELGELTAVDSLYAGFYEAVQLSQVENWATPTSSSSTDPNPQPNVPRRVDRDPNPQPNLGGGVHARLGPPMGDPNPQPNTPTEGDPNPQPNTPTGVVPSQPPPTP